MDLVKLPQPVSSRSWACIRLLVHAQPLAHMSINAHTRRRGDPHFSGGSRGSARPRVQGPRPRVCPTLCAVPGLASPALGPQREVLLNSGTCHPPGFQNSAWVRLAEPSPGDVTEIWEEALRLEKTRCRGGRSPPGAPGKVGACEPLAPPPSADQGPESSASLPCSGRQTHAPAGQCPLSLNHLPHTMSPAFSQQSRNSQKGGQGHLSFFPGGWGARPLLTSRTFCCRGRLSTPSPDSADRDTEPGNRPLSETPGKCRAQWRSYRRLERQMNSQACSPTPASRGQS